MSWNVEIADAAYQDLRDIYAYIAFELRSPEDAKNVLRRILSEIATLGEMPSRFRPYPREPLASQGVRVMDVGNYCVYYVARDEVVSVGRILYSHRDTDAVFAPGWSTQFNLRLFRALSGRKPFRAFRACVEELGILDDWYKFKDAAMLKMAEGVLEYYGVDFVDGRIVCTNPKNVHTFVYESYDGR